MIFLSLGAGVQSSVMLMMAIKGEIERPDHVIFADTGFEPKAVYKHASWCEKQCVKAGIPFHITKAKRNILEDFHHMELDPRNHFRVRPPLFMKGSRGQFGIAARQCTHDAKIVPLKKLQLAILGYKTAREAPKHCCEVMIGISTDEARRAKPSDVEWTDRTYPLIDPLKMSRSDCQSWWENHFPHIKLPSSSCIICPFKSEKMWRDLKDNSPDDWAKAVEYDDRFRAAFLKKVDSNGNATPMEVYVYRGLKPLSDVNLNEGQSEMDLEDEVYCAGGCGL